VLYFTRGFGPHDYRFLSTLTTTNYEIAYIPLFEGASRGVIAKLPEGVEHHEPLVRGNVLEWNYIPGTIREFRRRLDVIQPDLIHAGPIHLSAAITAIAGFHPFVAMSWGSDLLHEARKLWVAAVSRFTLGRSDAFVGDCNAVERKAIKLGMNSNRIVLFPWGTDLEHFSPGRSSALREELGWEDAFILISTRSFEPFYGVDLIIKALIRAAERRPGLRLLLLGEGSQRSLYKRWLADAGVEKYVHFAGIVPREDLPTYYRAADLYLSASYSDGSSVSLLEAMACGLPVLVSDIPGNREWVEPEINGWLFRSGEVDSLVRSIDCVCKSENLKNMGRSSRRVAEQRANWNYNFPKLLEAYQIAWENAKRAS
jgi:glycosyltransferase involved in cell wall biosynthesis